MDGEALLWTFADVWWPRLRPVCRAIKQPGGLGSRSARRLAGCSGWSRPGALRSDGRSQAEGDFGRARALAIAADQSWRFHLARAGCRAWRARVEGRLPLGVGVRPCREAELQKKAWWLANAIGPTWRGGALSGQSIKTASNLSGWSSSTRPGPGPIWLPCGDGRRVATG